MFGGGGGHKLERGGVVCKDGGSEITSRDALMKTRSSCVSSIDVKIRCQLVDAETTTRIIF